MAIMIDRDKLLIKIAAKQSLLKQGPEELIGGRIYWQIRGLDLAAQLTQGMDVEAEPVRHGRWLHGPYSVRCSACGDDLGYWADDKPYCPNCGAKMKPASNAVTGKDDPVCGVTKTPCTRCNPGPCGSRREGGNNDGK